jgi:hypothetical protein
MIRRELPVNNFILVLQGILKLQKDEEKVGRKNLGREG